MLSSEYAEENYCIDVGSETDTNYQCGGCGQCFNTEDDIKRHMNGKEVVKYYGEIQKNHSIQIGYSP